MSTPVPNRALRAVPRGTAPEAPGGKPARGKFEPRLIAIGESKPREYPLGRDKTTIGSESDNDVVIDAPSVSRHHAVIQRRFGAYSISDLESTNGTFINGGRLSNPAVLKRGDEVRFGTARFAFMDRGPSMLARIGAMRLRTMFIVAVMLFGIGFFGARYLAQVRNELESVVAPDSPTARSVAPVASVAPSAEVEPSGPQPQWLALLNWYRKMCKLAPVTEDVDLSHGDRAHVQYLLTNYSDAIRAGTLPGEEMHEEREGSPGYTSEGAEAGQQSDVDFVYWHGHKPEGLVNFAIIDWISGAFHRLPLLNPKLRRVGYDDFCGAGICVAALNATRGAEPSRSGQRYEHPNQFPPDGAQVDLRTFNSEWPDPLNSCPGYAEPTGLPITLALGTYVPAKLGSFAIESEEPGDTPTKVEACGFDADSYVSSDPPGQTAGREVLRSNSTVVVIPRRPLTRGATYHVSVTVNGTQYDWKFSVSS